MGSSERTKALASQPNHPALSEAANAKRRATHVANYQARTAWEQEHGRAADSERYRSEVLPLLAAETATALSKRIGLSVAYCAAIKGGERIPHPRWWDLLGDVPQGGLPLQA